MWISLSVNSGTSATSAAQARAKVSRSASRQWVWGIIASGMAGCSIGRISRTRRSTSPSSSIRLGAGTCTAARPDWLLTSSTARGSESRPSASSSVTGRLRSRWVMVSRRVSAEVPGWV